MRGGEKVLRELQIMFPDAPRYTLVASGGGRDLDPILLSGNLRTSWLQWLRFVPGIQRVALPFLPAAARSLDARQHDVVICSDAAIVKAIRTRPDALKICYCHSPMRYVWDLYDDYYAAAGPLGRLGLKLFAERIREADRAAAQTVTAFIANSRCVADRIQRCYRRSSIVIPPPVETEGPPNDSPPEDYYLVVGEHVHYKRNDLAIDACTRLGRPLVVIGGGPLLNEMRRCAGPTVRVLGWQDDRVVREHYRRCRALLFCGQEDFGMVPVEAQAAGRPVIAFASGGALETVVENSSGVFFQQQNVESVMDAVVRFEKTPLWPPRRIQEHSRRFSVERFRERFLRFYAWCIDLYETGGPDRVREMIESGESPVIDLAKAPWS